LVGILLGDARLRLLAVSVVLGLSGLGYAMASSLSVRTAVWFMMNLA